MAATCYFCHGLQLCKGRWNGSIAIFSETSKPSGCARRVRCGLRANLRRSGFEGHVYQPKASLCGSTKYTGRTIQLLPLIAVLRSLSMTCTPCSSWNTIYQITLRIFLERDTTRAESSRTAHQHQGYHISITGLSVSRTSHINSCLVNPFSIMINTSEHTTRYP